MDTNHTVPEDQKELIKPDDEKGINSSAKSKYDNQPTFWRVFCACKTRSNLKSIFQRPPAALKALDGLRAMAILWVFALHVGYIWGGYFYCAAYEWYFPALYLMSKGVDIFFVISGFLIAYILLKECEKFGSKIDILNFYRSRLLRIYPAMVPCCIAISTSYPKPWEMIYTLLFVTTEMNG